MELNDAAARIREGNRPACPDCGKSDDNCECDPIFGPIISRYTREQAIDDGVLVDLTIFSLAEARLVDMLGFRFHVAMTATAYGAITAGVRASDNAERLCRVNNLLMDLRQAVRGAVDTSMVFFTCSFVLDGETLDVSLKAICGPGDTAEPVITLMLPLED